MFKRLMRNTKGAVMAEFVIAIVPVMTTFFSFVQLSRIATARLVVKHSAIVGARAAAVMSNANDNTPDQPGGNQQGEVSNAVKTAMGPWFTKAGGFTVVNVSVTDSSSRSDPYGWVEVKVNTLYACNVPMGFIACGGNTKRLEETFRMPHQGAIYKQK
ncbi:MAG: pilus assembly protein [Labilithrix sp.]|nr:pilus assembly protein [Labilithrix sp.]MCW5815465.1 pilus assembly protein [Labilithrix sp.]